MKHRFLSLLANAINAYLLLDAESQHRLKRLQGRIFSIELLPFNITFNCHFDEKEMHIKTDSDEAAHTRIRGTPLQLLGLAFAKNNRQQFFADYVTI
jgi:ubiquinone biosynthesis protein UbiJ